MLKYKAFFAVHAPPLAGVGQSVGSKRGTSAQFYVVGMQLWHNPRCSKSRSAHDILDGRGIDYTERRYLDDPPSAEELDRVLTALGREPWEIARMGEDVAKDLGLKSWDHDRAKWIDAMVANPVLIERPILITDDGRAVLGRPPEAIESLLP